MHQQRHAIFGVTSVGKEIYVANKALLYQSRCADAASRFCNSRAILIGSTVSTAPPLAGRWLFGAGANVGLVRPGIQAKTW